MTGLGALTRWTRQLVASLLLSLQRCFENKVFWERIQACREVREIFNFSCLTFSALNKHNKGLKTLKHKWMIKTNARTATYEQKNTLRSDTRFKKPWRRLDFIPRFLCLSVLTLLPATRGLKATATTQHPRTVDFRSEKSTDWLLKGILGLP